MAVLVVVVLVLVVRAVLVSGEAHIKRKELAESVRAGVVKVKNGDGVAW